MAGSPVSSDGRGLKRAAIEAGEAVAGGSPVSSDGRGLKPLLISSVPPMALVRPSAVTGVD